jgi:hypothetical protein
MSEKNCIGKLFDITDFRKVWVSNKVRCTNCNHSWVGIYLAESLALECPACGEVSEVEII